jgi:hypothetical protein
VRSVVESGSAAYSNTIAAPHEYFHHSGIYQLASVRLLIHAAYLLLFVREVPPGCLIKNWRVSRNGVSMPIS